MAGPGSSDAFEVAARGLRMLTLRRHAYYLELLRSGRWRRYFTEQELAERLRDVVAMTRRWNALSGDAGPVAPVENTKSAA
jgi:hypothetical protein